MSKIVTVRKLSIAIKKYRGAKNSTSPTAKWIKAPQLNEIAHIRQLLVKLNMSVPQQDEAMKRIHGFATITEFETWIRTL